MTQPTLARSWVASANGHRDFPLQNLPLGVFSIHGSAPRSGVAIGDCILDLLAVRESTVVADFRHSRDRPSSLGIEVRKDLLCSFDRDTGAPTKPTERQKEVAGMISDAVATAIAIYLDEDRGVDEI